MTFELGSPEAANQLAYEKQNAAEERTEAALENFAILAAKANMSGETVANLTLNNLAAHVDVDWAWWRAFFTAMWEHASNEDDSYLPDAYHKAVSENEEPADQLETLDALKSALKELLA